MSTGSVETPRRYTAEEYLALERQSEEKHELVDGELRLMSGASRAHNLIAVNLAATLHGALKGKPCETYVADMRVKVSADGSYLYPDATIVCDEPEFEDASVDTLMNPNAVIEILSKSTASFDRGSKFASYRSLPSLREYVLIAQDAPSVEHFVRLDDGAWRFNPTTGLDQELHLVTSDLVLPLRDLYDKVQFETKED